MLKHAHKGFFVREAGGDYNDILLNAVRKAAHALANVQMGLATEEPSWPFHWVE